LRKRIQSQAAPWYLVSEINKRRFNHSLDSNIAAVAQKTAINVYIRPAREGRWQEVAEAGMKGNPLTVEELLRVWRRLPSERGETHVYRVERNFLNVLRRAGFSSPEKARLEAVLKAETVERWREAVLAECEGLSQERAGQIKRSQSSVLATGKCLFAAGALGDFKAAGLRVPDPAEFLRAILERRFQRMRKAERVLDRGEMRALVCKLLQEGDRNMRRAALLMLGFGLRLEEASQVRWEAWRPVDGSWWLDQEMDVKGGGGRLVAQGIDPWVRLLRRDRPADASGFVIEGTATERGNDVFRRVGRFMRANGWEEQKTNHALRAFAGGEVALKWGLLSAKVFLRHKKIATTERHYTDQWLKKAGRPSGIRWAKAAP